MSKLVFGTASLPNNAIIFAGMLYPQDKIQHILSLFDTATKLSDFQPVLSYRAKYKQSEWLLCFGAYGGTSALEITNLLAEGKVKNITFLGWAGAQTNIPIGSVVLPAQIRSFDGIVTLDDAKAKVVTPSAAALRRLGKALPQSTRTCHATLPGLGGLHGIQKVSRESAKYDTIDTELSVVIYFAQKNKIAAAGALIVTDSTKEHTTTINPDRKFTSVDRYKILENTVKAITRVV